MRPRSWKPPLLIYAFVELLLVAAVFGGSAALLDEHRRADLRDHADAYLRQSGENQARDLHHLASIPAGLRTNALDGRQDRYDLALILDAENQILNGWIDAENTPAGVQKLREYSLEQDLLALARKSCTNEETAGSITQITTRYRLAVRLLTVAPLCNPPARVRRGTAAVLLIGRSYDRILTEAADVLDLESWSVDVQRPQNAFAYVSREGFYETREGSGDRLTYFVAMEPAFQLDLYVGSAMIAFLVVRWIAFAVVLVVLKKRRGAVTSRPPPQSDVIIVEAAEAEMILSADQAEPAPQAEMPVVDGPPEVNVAPEAGAAPEPATARELYAAGKLEEAAKAYRAILAEQPEFYPALFNLALIQYKLDRPDAAAAYLTSYLEKYPASKKGKALQDRLYSVH